MGPLWLLLWLLLWLWLLLVGLMLMGRVGGLLLLGLMLMGRVGGCCSQLLLLPLKLCLNLFDPTQPLFRCLQLLLRLC